MRVIAGRLGGRQMHAPHGHRTHPMSEKMRGALFAVLGDIDGLTVLDGFAGSGALAIEALSRGAHQAVLVEHDQSAQQTIEQNLLDLDLLSCTTLSKTTFLIWSQAHATSRFDLVLLDPPYDKLQINSLQTAVQHLAAGGTLVLSWPGGVGLPDLAGLQCVSLKTYGDSQLAFYQHFK